MYLERLANSGTIPTLEKSLAFTEARHKVLINNIANIDTPYYKTQYLDPAKFQKQLRQAIVDRKKNNAVGLTLKDTDQVRQAKTGALEFKAGEEPVENILFHDQTNMRIEKQMSRLAENTMMHQTLVQLMQKRFEGLNKAIRGRVG